MIFFFFGVFVCLQRQRCVTANYKVCMQYVAHCTCSDLKELPFLRIYSSSCTFFPAFKLRYTEKKIKLISEETQNCWILLFIEDCTA